MTGSTAILSFIVCVVCASLLTAYGQPTFGYVVLAAGAIIALAGILIGDKGVL